MSTINLENKQILVVEDDEMNFIYINQIFKMTNAAITRARTGYEAIQLCLNNPRYDLILMDIQLPDIDGKEVTRKIRQILPEIPVIAQTAAKSEQDLEMIRQAGCTDVIVKPFKMEEMIRKIEKYF